MEPTDVDHLVNVFGYWAGGIIVGLVALFILYQFTRKKK